MGGLVEFGDHTSSESSKEYKSPIWQEPPVCVLLDIFLFVHWFLSVCCFGIGTFRFGQGGSRAAFWVSKSAALFSWASGESPCDALCNRQWLPSFGSRMAPSRARIYVLLLIFFSGEEPPLPIEGPVDMDCGEYILTVYTVLVLPYPQRSTWLNTRSSTLHADIFCPVQGNNYGPSIPNSISISVQYLFCFS